MKKVLLFQLYFLFASQLFAQNWEVISVLDTADNGINPYSLCDNDGDLYYLKGSTVNGVNIAKISGNSFEDILFNDTDSTLKYLGGMFSFRNNLIGLKFLSNGTGCYGNYFYKMNPQSGIVQPFRITQTLDYPNLSEILINNNEVIYNRVISNSLNMIDSTHLIVQLDSLFNEDTCFTFQWNNTFRFISTTPDGFIFYQEFPQGADPVNSFYQYSNTTHTYSQITMPDGNVTKGVEYQNGALLDGKMYFAFNTAGVNNIKFVNTSGTVQGWSDPNFIGPEYITKGDKGVFFSVQKENMLTGAIEYSVQKLVAPIVFSQLNYTEKFYYANGFGGYYETKPRLLAISKDYLYAYQPSKLDTVLMPGGLLRIKLLNQNNLPPTAVNDVFQLPDTVSSILTMRVNDADPNNDYIYSEILQTGLGTVEKLTNQDLIYTPPLYYTGNDTVIYKACDLGGLCSQPATIIIQVTASGVEPISADDQSQTYQAQNVLAEVINNDDVQNQSYAIEILQNGANGLGVLQGDSAIYYDPIDNFTGLDSIVYRLSRTTYAYADTATLYINVEPHPFAPTTEADTMYLTSSVTYVSPLVNDTNPTGGNLTLNVIDGPFAPGAYYGNQFPTVFYYYNTGYQTTDADSILYEACNASGLCTQEWIRFYGGNVGLKEELYHGGLVVYPNPTKDWVEIEINPSIAITEIHLIDNTGRKMEWDAGKNKFSVEGLSPGIYYLEIKSHLILFREKLIIQ